MTKDLCVKLHIILIISILMIQVQLTANLYMHNLYAIFAKFIDICKRVDIIYDVGTLEIFHGLKLVTTHNRDDTPYDYTQKSSHNLPGRRGSYEKDPDEIFQRAAAIDNIVLIYLKEVANDCSLS